MTETTHNETDTVRKILTLTYGIVPIVAGADKFTNLLTDWSAYLSPLFLNISPIAAYSFMCIVGVIEIAAGVLVLIRPSLGAYVVAAWLVLIAVQLITTGHFFDVAVRDLVMAVGAFCLARVSVKSK